MLWDWVINGDGDSRPVGLAMGLATDPMMGTWKLNEAKSTLAPETPKFRTIVFQPVGDKVKITMDGTDADGKPIFG